MDRAPVELKVGGQTYRVLASTTADDLQRLARVVDGKLRELSAGGAYHPQSLLLVALTLAHEVEEERQRRRDVESRARNMLDTLLERVDSALSLVEADEVPAAQAGAAIAPPPPDA